MGNAGIEILCYDWMPTERSVIRTSYTERTRGAVTNSFHLPTFESQEEPPETSTTDDQMWDDLEYFLRSCLPAAEAAGVKLAMHPDDPPLSPLAGYARIMRSPEAFDRLFDISSSECNGMTFCQGCFSEMGVDVAAAIRRFGQRILFAHFRDVEFLDDGVSFYETFQDNGQTDMVEAMRAYGEIGFEGVLRPTTSPSLKLNLELPTATTCSGACTPSATCAVSPRRWDWSLRSSARVALFAEPLLLLSVTFDSRVNRRGQVRTKNVQLQQVILGADPQSLLGHVLVRPAGQAEDGGIRSQLDSSAHDVETMGIREGEIEEDHLVALLFQLRDRGDE